VSPGDPKHDLEALKFTRGPLRRWASTEMMRNLNARTLRYMMRAAGWLMVQCLFYVLIRVHDQSNRSRHNKENGTGEQK